MKLGTGVNNYEHLFGLLMFWFDKLQLDISLVFQLCKFLRSILIFVSL